MKFDRNSDVTKNVKIIEWMKKELILSVGDVFDLIFKGVKPLDEALQDTLANIIMVTYLLAKRLGISFNEIDYKIKEKIKTFLFCRTSQPFCLLNVDNQKVKKAF